jgi:hypothetical protein
MDFRIKINRHASEGIMPVEGNEFTSISVKDVITGGCGES